MENEVMNYEEVMDTNFDVIDDVENEGTGIGTAVAIAIGAGLTLATGAIVKFGKKAWAAHKAKKELRQPVEGEVVEVTEADIQAVTKK